MPYENESNLQRSLDTIVYISDIKLTQIFKKFCSDFKLIQLTYFNSIMFYDGRSQWPRGLRRRSSAARLLRSWVRIPPRAWMFVL